MTILIGDKTVVAFHYTLTDDTGEQIDSSSGGEPLTYLHGASNIIPGLEKEMTGKTVGASFKIDIEPEEAYGHYQDELKQSVPRKMLGDMDDVQVGMQLEAQGANGEVQIVTVTGIEGEAITLDANHPLAGKQLTFEVNIETVREANPEEIEHGHVH